MPEQDETGWHLEKKVPISIILALFVQFIGGLLFINSIENRVTLLERDNIKQGERDARQEHRLAEAMALARAELKEIGAKLDRLIEKAAK